MSNLTVPDAQHLDVHFRANYREACAQRRLEAVRLGNLAERLHAAGEVSPDILACIAGALLEAYEEGHASCKESFARDARAQIDGALAQVRRQVLHTLDRAAESVMKR